MLKPNWKARGNWKFTQEQKDQLVALATSRPRDLGPPYSQWSLTRLRDEARNQRTVDSISLEWLRLVLDEADLGHQSSKAWKLSKDPKFEEKRKRIDRLTHQKHNPPIVLSMDEVGRSLSNPTEDRRGSARATPSGSPRPLRASWELGASTSPSNVCHQRLSGRLYRHKGGEPWLDYVQRVMEGYLKDQRVYLIQDNVSAHWTPEVRGSAKENRVTLVASATQPSSVYPVESHAGDLQKLVLAGSNSSFWSEVRREVARAITYRNRERGLRKKRFGVTQLRKRKIHRRPIWKRHYA